MNLYFCVCVAVLELPHVDQAALELPYEPLADLELRIPPSPP